MKKRRTDAYGKKENEETETAEKAAGAAADRLKPFCKRGHDLSKTRYFRPNGESHGCRECHNIGIRQRYANADPLTRRDSRKNWERNNPEAHKASRWKRWIKSEYGVDFEAWNAMYNAQSGRCAICGDKSDKRLHVDHDHKTGKFRALLCNACNSAVAQVREDPMRAYRVATYLERHVGEEGARSRWKLRASFPEEYDREFTSPRNELKRRKQER